MSKFTLSNRSMNQLFNVHPDLIKVLKRGIELTPYDFGITEGARSIATQHNYFESGKSTTMDSLHLAQKDGYAHAVDLYLIVDGKATWEHKYFRKVIQALFTAAIELGVQIEAGALWRDFLDSPHIQLNQKYYGVL